MPAHPLKSAIKRGALIAAANWQVTLIQATADSLFKLLLTVPIIGGVFLVALAIGSEPQALMTLQWRELAATIVSSLVSRPVVLAAFVLAAAVVAVGGSFFVFLIKAGTVATLVRSDRDAGPIEEPPLHIEMVTRAARFSVDLYIAWAGGLFPRYARLGCMLMAVYLASAVIYLAALSNSIAADSWSLTALLTAAFVTWITLINLLYLLTQVVVAADDCSVAAGMRRVAAFLRAEYRRVTSIFGLVLLLVVAATAASLLATTALSLVAFVPFAGLAALPLQLVAWLLRALVFQYLGLTSAAAYLRAYRESAVGRAATDRLDPASTFNDGLWGRASAGPSQS